MTERSDPADISGIVATYLPFLRRFSRALTGSQAAGDTYAAATLEAVLADREVFDRSLEPKVALFRVFNGVWASSGAAMEASGDESSLIESAARARLESLTPHAREALLLRALEDFDNAQIGQIMGIPEDEAQRLADIGSRELEADMQGNVLIIEDEAIIAIEIQSIVEELGHKVIALSRTHEAAVAAVANDKPDLVLADIHLADGSSGIDAVNDILSASGETPVIFITAYPERLLTGERPEPTFLIPKPFKVGQVRTAIQQALFFRNAALVSL